MQLNILLMHRTVSTTKNYVVKENSSATVEESAVKIAADQKRRDVVIPGDTLPIASYPHVPAYLLSFYTTYLCTFMQNVQVAVHIPRDPHALVFAPGVITY